MLVNDPKIKFVIENFLSNEDTIILKCFYHDNLKGYFLYKSFGVSSSGFYRKRDKILNKLRSYLELLPYYIELLNDDELFESLTCVQVQILYYLILLYDRYTIRLLTGLGSNKISKEYSQIYLIVCKKHPEFVRILKKMKSKYLKSGVKSMLIDETHFPLFCIRNKIGNFCSNCKDRLVLYQDRQAVIDIIKEIDPDCEKRIGDYILFEFSTIFEFSWFIKRNPLIRTEIIYRGDQGSIILEVDDVRKVVELFGNKNPFKA